MSTLEPNATITQFELFNPELALFRIRIDGDQGLPFEPGQYAELALPGEIIGTKVVRRQYSIGSPAQASQELEFYIVLVPDGFFTPKLWQLQVGSRLWINPKPKGKFTIEPVPSTSNLVMFATGTGLAPFLSMVKTYRGEKRWERFTIIHGARHQQDLGYREELEALAAEESSFFYIPTVTRDSSWSGHQGRVLTVIQDGTYEQVVGTAFAPETTQVFLCGNPAMIDEAQTVLESQGFKLHSKRDPGNLHIERYW